MPSVQNDFQMAPRTIRAAATTAPKAESQLVAGHGNFFKDA
jgi:hypothetical protein